MPEDDPLSLSLQEQGIDSTLMILGLGTLFYVLLAYFVLVILQLILHCLAKKLPKVNKTSSKISKFLYWNGIIRLFIEVYLDFGVCAFLQIKTMYWDDNLRAVSFGNILAIITVACLGILPIFAIIFFIKRVETWSDKGFQAKYGSLIEGTNQDFKTRKWLVLFMPFSHFMRRLILALTVIFWFDFFWG